MTRIPFRKSLSILALVATVFLISNNAFAANQYSFGGMSSSCFTHAAVAMTPYDRSIQGNVYRMTHERVYHNTSKTGMILLYGPLRPWQDMYGDNARLNVSYIDPDGPGQDAYVAAAVRHIGPRGLHIIRTLNSNHHAQTTKEVQTMSVAVPYNELDEHEGFYDIRVYVVRSNTSVSPVVFGYSMCSNEH